MQWATYLRYPISELMYPARRIGTALSTNRISSSNIHEDRYVRILEI